MISIRPAISGDAASIAEIYRPFVETSWTSFETEAPDGADIAERLARAGVLYPWLIAEDDAGVLGYAYGSPHRTRQAYITSVETTIYLASHAGGKGVGKRLYQSLIETLSRQNYVSAYAGIVLPNEASIALHRAVGFEFVGTYPNVGYKHGQWRETQWWQCPLAEPQSPPRKILPFTSVLP